MMELLQTILSGLTLFSIVLVLIRLKHLSESVLFMRRYFLKMELRALDLNCRKCGKPIKDHTLAEANACGIRL